RVFSRARGRNPARHRVDGYPVRHGAWRLDVGSDLRSYRLLSRRIPQWPCLESPQHADRGLAAHAAGRTARRACRSLIATRTKVASMRAPAFNEPARLPATFERPRVRLR